MSPTAVLSRWANRRCVRVAKRGAKRFRRALRIEPLEDRRLLSVDPGIAFLQQSVDWGNRSPNAADAGQPVVYLYSNSWAGGTYGDLQTSAMTLDGNDPNAGQGVTSLRATWNGTGANGWFQFWLGEGQTNRPRDIPEFGLARYVRFLAKGDTAGQDLEVRIFKVPAGGGWQLVKSVPIDLSTGWQDFGIDLAGLNLKPHDLHAVQFVIGDGANDGGRTFWVDEVRVDTDGFDPLRVPVSYRAQYGDPASGDLGYRDARIYPNRSFLYDSALTIKALFAAGDASSVQMARQVTDAIVATKLADGSYSNDRNSGHVLLENGTPRVPVTQKRTLGDQAWFGLALLDAYRQTGVAGYLDRAIEISNWAENNLKDNGAWQGYRGGYDGDGLPCTWRATEHNIDLFALNRGIAVLLSLQHDAREADFVARATYAGDFVMHMYDPVGGKFWTGTGVGDTLNTDSVPLDAQTWSLLTLARFPQYAEAIDWSRVANWVEDHLQVVDGSLSGLTYSDHSTPNIVWLEGTAQGAVVASLWRKQADYESLVGQLQEVRSTHPNGDGRGLVAASRDTLQDVPLGAIYDARLHVGATAWTYFATAGINPMLPQMEIPTQATGKLFVVDDWNNKVTESDLGSNYFAGNSGAVESTAGTMQTGLSSESNGTAGGSLDLNFDFTGAPAESFAGVFTSLFGLTDTLVSLDGSGVQPASTTAFPNYYLDMTDIYRGFGTMSGRSIERMQFDVKLASSAPVTLKIQLQDEAGFDVFTRRTINPAGGAWQTISVDVPGGFDHSLAGQGNPAGFNWQRVSLCTLIVERENVGDNVVNPDTGHFLVDNLQLIDANGVYPDVAAAAAPTGLGLNPYFEESFLNLARGASSQYFVDWASTDPRTGGMIQDRSTFADLETVGGAGFQLTSYVVDAEQDYLTRADAAARVRDLLRVLRDQPQGPGRVGTNGYQGFFYHFLGIDGLRKQNFDFTATPQDESQNTVELSSIDTALALAGVVTAGQYFDAANGVETEIRQLANEIYGRVDFRFMLNPASNQFYLGWKPNETRDDTGKWGRFLLNDAAGTGQYSSKPEGGVEQPATLDFYTDEGLLLALLAMGSPNPDHRLGREVWDAMIRDKAGGDFVRTFPGSLFTDEFASVWLDTQRLGLDNQPTTPIDFFANTQAAVQATRAYVEQNPLDRATWRNDARLWGLSAAEGPLDAYHAYAAPTAALARHAGWLGTTYTLEAEAGTGDGSINSRTNASGGQTVGLHSGEARTMSVNLTADGAYELSVRYSNDNDGPLETVTVSVDGTTIGSFQAQDTGNFGAGWNSFEISPPLGARPPSFHSGNHLVTVTVSCGDGNGVEIDKVTLDQVQPLEDGTVTVYGSASAIEHAWFGATDSLWRATELGLLHPRFGYADAYNADVADAIEAGGSSSVTLLRTSGPWANVTGFAIDQGPLALMLDNYLSHNFVPSLFMSQPHIQRALMTLFPAMAGNDAPLNPPSASIDHLEETSDDWGVYVEGSPTWELDHVPTPSLDSNSLRLAVTGGDPYSNAYVYRLFQPEPNAVDFAVTFPFQFSPASSCDSSQPPAIVQAIEFSMNTWVDSQRYEWALQWENVGNGHDAAPQWRYWDPSQPQTERWLALQPSISQCLVGEQWHTLTLRGKIRNGATYYQSFTVDGQRHQLDISVPPAPDTSTPPQMSIAVQLDGNYAESPYAVSLDEVTFTRAVYVDDRWAGTADGATPAASSPAGLAFGDNAFASLQAAADAVEPNGKIIVYGGQYPAAFNVNKPLQPIQLAVNPLLPGETTVQVAVPGTPSDEVWAFESLSSVAPPSHTLRLDGISYAIPASVKLEVNVDAAGGHDTATLTDWTGGLAATLHPTRGTITGLGYTVNLESAETVNLLAYSGGQAFLFDSAGDDTFRARPTGVSLQGTNFNNSLTGFTQVYSYSRLGGSDTALLYDSAGNDVFLADGKANGSRLQGANLDYYAEGFKQTYAYATGGGADTAKLYDSGGADLFQADGKANGVRLQGPGIDLYAEGFEKTYAYATKGGVDTAKLYDSAGDDLFLADGKANGARLQGPGIDLYAEGFEKTYAYATKGGTDTAQLYDSAGDDTFAFDGVANGARLQGGGIDLYAEGFEKTYAYATKGGTDTATMVDSAGDDTFTFDYPGGRFQGAGFDAYAEGFDHYFASATRGGYDRSYLYDSNGNDALQGRSNWYLLTTPLATVRGEGFDYVKATKHEAGTNTLDVSAVDYLFEGSGWS
ncbi:MAG: hypothetical protein NTY19_24295 [Planctomycetota bacterium]|nr:hypothetical protein [Planctomycetota bacterium]